MRITLLTASAILASLNLTYAIPHAGAAGAAGAHNHNHFHKRDPATTTTIATTAAAAPNPAIATEIVYVTDYAATVWVDPSGKIINTEYKTPPPTTATSAPATTASSTTSASATGLAKGAVDKVADVTGKKDGSSSHGASGMGVCYDMIDNGSNCKDPGTINSDFTFLKSQGFTQVRVYDVGCSVADYINAANSHGMKLMVGINGIANMQGDLAKLIGYVAGNWGTIHTVYIGNELVNNGMASAEDVAGAVTTARGILSGAGYNGDVITVDTFMAVLAHPNLCSTSSYCAANTHAFFDPNTAPENAGTFVRNAYNNMKAAVGGKRVVVTESGWPYRGNCNGAACPGADAQRKAMSSVVSAFAGDVSNLYLFQAYNAGYKHSGALGVEQYFGIFDSDHYAGGLGLKG